MLRNLNNIRPHKVMLLVLSLMIISMNQVESKVWKQFMNNMDEVPLITWPNSFETVLSNNDPGFNITEILYFNGYQHKVRLQIYYAILGLEPSKGIDITIDEKNNIIALRTDVDCKYTSFHQSLNAISLFFSLWSVFTEHKGVENDLHKFQVSQLSNKKQTHPSFYFFFDQHSQLNKVRLEQDNVGSYDFYALVPVRERLFTDDDFSNDSCERIPSIILEEAKTFVTFMQSMVEELIGNEDYMIQQLADREKEEKQREFLGGDDTEEDEDYRQYVEYMKLLASAKQD